MNDSQKLMAARLGLYQSGTDEQVDGLSALLQHQGGNAQQNRMIKDKYRSFLKALQYSYQGAFISPFGSEEEIRALINPNKVKQDYDDKIISVDYKYNIKTGSVFKWLNTDTYWLVYLQDLTELAYFKGDIRRCNYTISWRSEDGEILNSYAAVRGPVETKINFVQKNGITIDTPNYSLSILMPKNDDTIKFFKRYAKFYLKEYQDICWRVEAVDSISTPGIIEIIAVEYYINEDLDSDGIANNIVIEQDTSEIKGESIIYPKLSYTYIAPVANGSWVVNSKDVTLSIIDEYSISLIWNKNYGGEIVLQCDDYEKNIKVNSLF